MIDVLEKWANVIGGSVNSRTTLADCIADLAAAVRTERARVAELERELAFADSDVAAKRSYIEELGCEMAVAKRLDSDQFEEIEGLRARVAGLETQLDRECVVCGKGARPGTVDMLNARVAELEADARRDIVTEVGTLALHPIVETRISESEFQDSVCPACKGHEDDGHVPGCVWGDFVGVINAEMEDQ